MAFPTDDFVPESLDLQVTAEQGGFTKYVEVKLNFPLAGFSNDMAAAYEEAVEDAITAFVTRIEEEFVNPATVTRVYRGVKVV